MDMKRKRYLNIIFQRWRNYENVQLWFFPYYISHGNNVPFHAGPKVAQPSFLTSITFSNCVISTHLSKKEICELVTAMSLPISNTFLVCSKLFISITNTLRLNNEHLNSIARIQRMEGQRQTEWSTTALENWQWKLNIHIKIITLQWKLQQLRAFHNTFCELNNL